jgi:Cu+-exporting ATPase
MKNLLVFIVAIVFAACSTGQKETKEKVTQTAEMTEVTLNIGGMHCENCVASIEKGINGLEGIEKVVVTLNDSTAVVNYDASKLELAQIEKAVQKRGFKVKNTQ